MTTCNLWPEEERARLVDVDRLTSDLEKKRLGPCAEQHCGDGLQLF